MSTQPQLKNPALAAILSFLLPGLGQIYNGEVGKGIVIIVVQVVNILLMAVIIGFFTGFAVMVWAIYDAYKTAEKLNAEIVQQDLTNTKVCPQCAERVQSGAKVCRHCSYQFVPVQPQPVLAAPVEQEVLQPTLEEPQPVAVAASTKVCPNCSGENASDAQFCMSCGQSFAEEQVVEASPSTVD